MLMFFLYSFLYTIVFVCMSPLFLLRRKKYASGFKQRLGFLPKFTRDGRPVIWIHCVSVGETNAARPLVKKILEQYSNYRLVVSTTTKTGQELAQDLFAEDADLIFYFPFDWRWTVRKVLRKLNPNMILIMETEIWFNFLKEAHRNRSRVFIINGRLSDKSVKRYRWISKTMKRVMRYVDAALMQTPADARRLVKLGVNINKVKVTGNFKFDQKRDEKEMALISYFKERFGFLKDAPLIVAASTHEPEERWILDAFKIVYKSGVPNLPRLMIVPRHPERFEEVAELIDKTGFSWIKRTSDLGQEDELADIVLLDTIGELRSVYPLAEIVFIGGSLIPHGGQNILEPALEKKAIVTGYHMFNFEAMVKEFNEKNAFIQLPKLKEKKVPEKLAETFQFLLEDDELRETLSKRAYSLMSKNRGATEKTLHHLKPYLQVQGNVLKK